MLFLRDIKQLFFIFLYIPLTLALFALGLTEIIFGSSVFQFAINIDIGAFYGGVFSVLTGLLEIIIIISRSETFWIYFFYESKHVVILNVLGVIGSFIGLIVDAIGYNKYVEMEACINGTSYAFGNPSYFSDIPLTCFEYLSSNDTISDGCFCITQQYTEKKNTLGRCTRFRPGNGFTNSNCKPIVDGMLSMRLSLVH